MHNIPYNAVVVCTGGNGIMGWMDVLRSISNIFSSVFSFVLFVAVVAFVVNAVWNALNKE